MTRITAKTRVSRVLEQVIERKFRLAVLMIGGECIKLSGGSRGMPDRMVLLPGGRAIFVEVKRPGGVVSMHQLRWIARLRDLGFVAEVVKSLEEGLAAIQNMPASPLANQSSCPGGSESNDRPS